MSLTRHCTQWRNFRDKARKVPAAENVRRIQARRVAGSTEGQQMFRRAVQALAEGRPGCVAVANRALFGRSDYPQGGIFALLLRRGYERAALRFQTAWFEAVRRAMEREEAERRRP
jgi:hypothetical protein